MKKPGIVTRARAAYKFFQHGWEQFDLKKSGPPFIWPTWRNNFPQWPTFDYSSYAQEGFNENAVVYAALMYKIRSLAAAPLRAYTTNNEGQPELLPKTHPLAQLIARPNRYQSWSEFQGLADAYLNLGGNAYIVVDRETPALYPLRPDRVYPVPYPDNSQKELMGFLYVPEGLSQQDGVPYLPQDIIHVRLPNPLDPMDGMGRGNPALGPAARSTDVDNSVTKYLKLFFSAGAMPPGLLKYKMTLDDADVKRAKERWRQTYGGSENWADIVVLDQEGEYQRLGLSFDEMGFGPLDERNEARIAMVIGVPPILIGARLGLTRSSYGMAYEQARRAFWEDTLTPELRMFEVEYQYYLNTPTEYVAFDLSKVPALTLSVVERQRVAGEAFRSGGITRNDYRVAIGFEPVPDGDIYLMSTGAVPAESKSYQPGQLCPYKDCHADLALPEAGWYTCGSCNRQFWCRYRIRDYEDYTCYLPTEGNPPARPTSIPTAAVIDKRALLVLVNEEKQAALKERRSIQWERVLSQAGRLSRGLEQVFKQAIYEGWSVEVMTRRLERGMG